MATWLRRHRADLAVCAVAAVWFFPAVWWGLPVAGTAVPRPWGPDEMAPWYVQAFLDALAGGRNTMSPQYPLFHYFPLAVIATISAKLGASLAAVTLFERLPSVLMAAGCVAFTGAATRRATGSAAAGLVASAATAFIGPMVFLGRTSNTDVPSLFWVTAALVPIIACLRDGLTLRRAATAGILAGLGTATKDQQYAVFAGLGLAVLAAHIATTRRAGTGIAWGALAAAVAAGGGTWVLASGLVLLPGWFREHVAFILRGGSPQASEETRRLAGFYGSNPATLAGYGNVLREAGAQVVAAMGIPLLALSAGGVIHAARRDRLLLLLLLGPLALIAGVLLPVRFVLPRFLLPVEVTLALFAGVGYLAAQAADSLWRTAARATLALGIAWSALRGADLTWQMLRDSRYQAGAWLRGVVQPGDTVGYYGARLKLPTIPGGAVLVQAPFQPGRAGGQAAASTDFIIVVPQQAQETTHEWVLPDSSFARLLDGSAGYRQVLAIQTRGLFTRPLRVVPFVNPPVRVFAREDALPRVGTTRIELPNPVAHAPQR